MIHVWRPVPINVCAAVKSTGHQLDLRAAHESRTSPFPVYRPVQLTGIWLKSTGASIQIDCSDLIEMAGCRYYKANIMGGFMMTSWNGTAFHTLLALCEGNQPITSGFHTERQTFNNFFHISLKKLLTKHSSGRWCGIPWHSCAITVMLWRKFLCMTDQFLFLRISQPRRFVQNCKFGLVKCIGTLHAGALGPNSI